MTVNESKEKNLESNKIKQFITYDGCSPIWLTGDLSSGTINNRVQNAVGKIDNVHPPTTAKKKSCQATMLYPGKIFKVKVK